jgi:hypothetical protein
MYYGYLRHNSGLTLVEVEIYLEHFLDCKSSKRKKKHAAGPNNGQQQGAVNFSAKTLRAKEEISRFLTARARQKQH